MRQLLLDQRRRVLLAVLVLVELCKARWDLSADDCRPRKLLAYASL